MSGMGYVHAVRHAALGQSAALLASLRDIGAPEVEIAATLRAHHVSGLVREALSQMPAAGEALPGLLAALEAVGPLPVATAAELRAGFEHVRERLARDGIPVLLLKGQSLAQRLYREPSWRPQFDVDLLVRQRQHRRAVRLLAAEGFARCAYDQHSTTLVRGSLKLDLHWCLRAAPAYATDEDALWASARTVQVSGLEARTLSDEHTLLLLILSAFEDLGQGSAKLKQVLDLYLFTRLLEADTDWDRFFHERAAEGLEGVASAVLALVVALFDAQPETPALTAALERRAYRADAAAARTALALVCAERKSPGSLAWFRQVYPGSFPHFLLRFWLGSFPANVRGLWTGRAADAVFVALGRRQRT